jgi:hypothetical protein
MLDLVWCVHMRANRSGFRPVRGLGKAVCCSFDRRFEGFMEDFDEYDFVHS